MAETIKLQLTALKTPRFFSYCRKVGGVAVLCCRDVRRVSVSTMPHNVGRRQYAWSLQFSQIAISEEKLFDNKTIIHGNIYFEGGNILATGFRGEETTR